MYSDIVFWVVTSVGELVAELSYNKITINCNENTVTKLQLLTYSV